MEALVSSDMWSCRARVASGFRQRLLGLRGAPENTAMLLETWSVHGFGMRRPLVVVGIDRNRRVIGTRTLHPNRVVGFRGARYVLEMPVGTTPPPVGVEVRIEDV